MESVFRFSFLGFKIFLSVLISVSHTLLFLTYVSKELPMAYWANTVSTHRCSRSKMYSIVFLHSPSLLPPGKHQLVTQLSCVHVMSAYALSISAGAFTSGCFSCFPVGINPSYMAGEAVNLASSSPQDLPIPHPLLFWPLAPAP